MYFIWYDLPCTSFGVSSHTHHFDVVRYPQQDEECQGLLESRHHQEGILMNQKLENILPLSLWLFITFLGVITTEWDATLALCIELGLAAYGMQQTRALDEWGKLEVRLNTILTFHPLPFSS